MRLPWGLARIFGTPTRADGARGKAARLRAQADRIKRLSQRPDLAARAHAVSVEFCGRVGLRRFAERHDVAQIARDLFERDARDGDAMFRHTRNLSRAGWTAGRKELVDDRFAFVRGCLAYFAQDFGRALVDFEIAARDSSALWSAAAAAEIARFILTWRLDAPAIVASMARAGDAIAGSGLVLVVAQPSTHAYEAPLAPGRPYVALEASPSIVSKGKRVETATIGSNFLATQQGGDIGRDLDEMTHSVAEAFVRSSGDDLSLAPIAAHLRAQCFAAWSFACETRRLIEKFRPRRVVVIAGQALFAQAQIDACGSTPCSVIWTARPRLEVGVFSYWPRSGLLGSRVRLLMDVRARVGGASRESGAMERSSLPTDPAERCDATSSDDGDAFSVFDLKARWRSAVEQAVSSLKGPRAQRAAKTRFLRHVVPPLMVTSPFVEQWMGEPQRTRSVIEAMSQKEVLGAIGLGAVPAKRVPPAERLASMMARPELRSRALAGLLALYGRRPLSAAALRELPVEVWPELFDAAATNFALTQKLATIFARAGEGFRKWRISAPEYEYVRAVLAYGRLDHTRARAHFMAWAHRHPERASGAAAELAARFIDASGLDSPTVRGALGSAPDLSKRSARPWLVVISPGAAAPSSLIPADQPIVTLAARTDIPPALGGRIEAAHVVDDAFRRHARGAHLRASFDTLAKRFGEAMAAAPRRMGTAAFVADVLRARSLYTWFYMNEVARISRAGKFDRVIVITGDPIFFEAVAKAVAASRRPPEAVWTARPRFEMGSFSYWPSRADILSRMSRSGAGVAASGKSLIVASLLRTPQDVERLRRTLAELGSQVGVDVLIDGPEASAACARALVATRPRRISVTRASALDLALGSEDRRASALAASAKVLACHGRFGLEAHLRRAVVEGVFPRILAFAPEFAHVSAAYGWLMARDLPLAVVGDPAPGEPTWLATARLGAARSAVEFFTPRAMNSAHRPGDFASEIALRLNLEDQAGVACGGATLDRAAVCVRAIQRGVNRERAERMLAQMWRDRLVKASALPETLYPTLFNEYALDIAPATRLCAELVHWRPTSQQARASDAFAFTRGLLAFYRHDFSSAHREFERCSATFPGSNAALASEDLLEFFNDNPLHDAHYRNVRMAQAGLKMSAFRGKSVLVVSEASVDDVENALSDLPSTCRVKYVVRFLSDLARVPRSNWEYDYMHRNFEYMKEGKDYHKHLERMCEDVAAEIGKAIPALQPCPFGVKAHLVDGAFMELWVFERVETLLKTQAFDSVIVVTRRNSFYRTIRDIVRNFSRTKPVDLVMIGGIRPGAPPCFIYWPKQELRKARFFLKKTRRDIPKCARTAAPAMFMWSIGEKTYETALKRAIEAAARGRDVVVMAIGRNTDAEISAFRDEIKQIVDAAGRRLLFVHYNLFLREARARPGVLRAATRAALAAAPSRHWLRGDACPSAAAFMRGDLAYNYVDSYSFGAIEAAMQWLAVLFARNKPAYVVTSPGRLSFHAAIAEFAQSRGVPAADLHLFFVGDAARQMPTPHRYYATLDTMVARFVTNYWGVPAENVVRVGYLWGEKPAEVGEGQQLDRREGEFLIVYASQPIDVETASAVAESILKIVARFSHVRLLVKPHPNDERASLDWIANRIRELGLETRAEVTGGRKPIAPMLEAADLVVTRTSNVALEAALRFRAVVRAIMYDLVLPPTSLDVPYAVNARDHESFEAALAEMIADPQARERQRRDQVEYLQENPSLRDLQGHVRMIDFMEKLASRAGRES